MRKRPKMRYKEAVTAGERKDAAEGRVQKRIGVRRLQ